MFKVSVCISNHFNLINTQLRRRGEGVLQRWDTNWATFVLQQSFQKCVFWLQFLPQMRKWRSMAKNRRICWTTPSSGRSRTGITQWARWTSGACTRVRTNTCLAPRLRVRAFTASLIEPSSLHLDISLSWYCDGSTPRIISAIKSHNIDKTLLLLLLLDYF